MAVLRCIAYGRPLTAGVDAIHLEILALRC